MAAAKARGKLTYIRGFCPREPLDLEDYFLDTTALKANIHFPVDWVWLRDGVRTLMKATMLIREQGLKGRMEPPQEFLRRINRLSLAMTHQRRGADSRQGRKLLWPFLFFLSPVPPFARLRPCCIQSTGLR